MPYVNTLTGVLFTDEEYEKLDIVASIPLVEISKEAYDNLKGVPPTRNDVPLGRGEVQDHHEAQVDMVLKYLKEHPQGLTSKEAFDLLGISYLPVKIQGLERRGVRISRTSELVKNRNGRCVRVNRYTLAKPGEWF